MWQGRSRNRSCSLVPRNSRLVEFNHLPVLRFEESDSDTMEFHLREAYAVLLFACGSRSSGQGYFKINLPAHSKTADTLLPRSAAEYRQVIFPASPSNQLGQSHPFRHMLAIKDNIVVFETARDLDAILQLQLQTFKQEVGRGIAVPALMAENIKPS